MKIVIDNKIPFIKNVFEPFADVEYIEGMTISNSDLLDADALIIRTRTRCNKQLLDGTAVKFIATATIGFDHIDTTYCEQHGIQWTNAPGCNSGSVQQWFMSALLTYAAEQKIDLTTRTLGIIGVGNVGKKILRFADSLGLKVLINDPPRARNEGTCGFNSLGSLIKECDILTLHVPLNMTGDDKTHHLFDLKKLAKLNPGCLLINSSRGEVIDNNALIEYSLKTGTGDIILDVWENEPDINTELLKEVYFATPHIAGYSTDGKANGTAIAVQKISEYFGLPLSDWYPDELPSPENSVITIDAKLKSKQKFLTEIIQSTYSIREDHTMLINSPESFESQRGNYPIRREPAGWQVNLYNDKRNYKMLLERLGFQVKVY